MDFNGFPHKEPMRSALSWGNNYVLDFCESARSVGNQEVLSCSSFYSSTFHSLSFFLTRLPLSFLHTIVILKDHWKPLAYREIGQCSFILPLPSLANQSDHCYRVFKVLNKCIVLRRNKGGWTL